MIVVGCRCVCRLFVALWSLLLFAGGLLMCVCLLRVDVSLSLSVGCCLS